MSAVAVVTTHRITSAGIGAIFDGHPTIRVAPDSPGGVLAAPPDVVLYDLVALHDRPEHELDALVATPGLVVLGLTSDLRPGLADRARTRGLDGFVSVTAPREEIVAAVEAACRPRRRAGSRSTPAPMAGAQAASLTPRETDMLQRIAAGYTNQEICEELFLSINIVKTFIRSAYQRIGVKHRGQAVVWALQHGIVLEPRDSAPARPRR